MKSSLRLLAVLAPIAVMLTGCAGNDPERDMLLSFVQNYLTGTHEKVSVSQAAGVPYASLGLEFGSGPQVLLVLGMGRGGERDWYAGEAIFVRTQAGRVLRTAGFPNDLGGISLAPGVPGQANEIAYTVDLPDMAVFGAAAQCMRTQAGDETLRILETNIATRHIVERCEVPAIDWKFNNDYWVDPADGYVWRTQIGRAHV